MGKVVTFGEIMMRLDPKGYRRFVQAEDFDVSYAGGEANAAVGLVQLGETASFVTKLPAHEVGQAALNAVRRYGVDTSFIVRGGARLGIYFIEKGASQRASKVIYDRAGSALALSSAADYDWDNIFSGADWFHFTGITPALGGELPDICKQACLAARKAKVTVSCDLNYRKKLWSREQAREVMEALMPFVDVCIANEEDAADVFGICAERTDVHKGELNREGYISVARQIHEKYGCARVAITLRGSLSASVNTWGGMLYQNGNAYFSPEYTVQIVDRVGGGDSFGAGLIYALKNGFEPQRAVNLAAAASCLKHTIEKDFNLITLAEAESLAAGNASGRVQR